MELGLMGQSSPWGGDRISGMLDATQHGVCIVNQQYDVDHANSVILDQFGPVQGLKCYQHLRNRKDVCLWCNNEAVFGAAG